MGQSAASSAASGGKPGARARGISVVVPTYNEVENIEPLTRRLYKAMQADERTKPYPVELLFVDDESKGSEKSVEIAEKLQKELGNSASGPGGFSIRVHRRYKHQGRGLSSAVMLGLKSAKYDVCASMDADLQHEPEAVPEVVTPVLLSTGAEIGSDGDAKTDGKSHAAEFTVGCRYGNEGGAGGIGFEWSLFRQVLSTGATALASGVAQSRDPMSGFFCTRWSTLEPVCDRGQLSGEDCGWKIGLECMARSDTFYARENRAARKYRFRVRDVAITFRERVAGESKLTFKQNIEYLKQLGDLYWSRYGIMLLVVLAVLVLIALYVLMQLAAAAGLA